MKTSDAQVPDLFYAFSKLHGENLGRLSNTTSRFDSGDVRGTRARAVGVVIECGVGSVVRGDQRGRESEREG